MSRLLVLADAGYVLGQTLQLLDGRSGLRRDALDVFDPAGLVRCLVEHGRRALGLSEGARELLRVCWYDGVPNSGPSDLQRSLIEVDDLVLRAGSLNVRGHQRGVDTLMVADLIELCGHGAVSDVVLISGDADLAVALDHAQRRGVRVALLGLGASASMANLSFELLSRAERVRLLGAEALRNFVRLVAEPAGARPEPALARAASGFGVSARGDDDLGDDGEDDQDGEAFSDGHPGEDHSPALDEAVYDFYADLTPAERRVAVSSVRGIERSIDARLLLHLKTEVTQRALSEAQKHRARDVLRRLIEDEAAA